LLGLCMFMYNFTNDIEFVNIEFQTMHDCETLIEMNFKFLEHLLHQSLIES